MMKHLMLALALTAGSTAAIAQDQAAPPPETQAPQTPPTPDPTPAPNTPPGSGVTQQGTDPQGTAVTPPGANEAPVVAPVGDPALAVPQQAPFTPQPPQSDYPACSKSVTDRCTQIYERGARKPRR